MIFFPEHIHEKMTKLNFKSPWESHASWKMKYTPHCEEKEFLRKKKKRECDGGNEEWQQTLLSFHDSLSNFVPILLFFSGKKTVEQFVGSHNLVSRNKEGWLVGEGEGERIYTRASITGLKTFAKFSYESQRKSGPNFFHKGYLEKLFLPVK